MNTAEIDLAPLPRRRDSTFHELRDALSPANVEGALRCSIRLRNVLPYADDLSRNLVMVAYGGGKDSSYTLAFVRLVQLILFRVHGRTFRLRVVTNRHAGMPRAVLENVDRAYRALRLYEDPDCELLLIDGDEVTPFDVETPQRAHVIERNRADILLTGHRTFGDGRPTFCNACNLSMVNAFGLAAGYGRGVDVIITGDSRREQRAYAVWVNRLARRVTPGSTRAKGGFKGFLKNLDDIAQTYFVDIHGADAPDAIDARRIRSDVPSGLQFFSIFEDTAYSAGDHFSLLTEYLGFVFDDVAFSFTESDCANPMLMAHLRGLKCERLYGRSYRAGVEEYVEFALALMRKKEYPEHLVDIMRARYHGPQGIDRMRRRANAYALEAYRLTEEQLVCMVYSPFAEKAAGLERYFWAEQPGLAHRVEEAKALIAGESLTDERPLAAVLERVSGLALPQLEVLYRSRLLSHGAPGDESRLLNLVLDGDPHKAVIPTRHEPDGPVVFEQISGR
jgi:hypothetical protein